MRSPGLIDLSINNNTPLKRLAIDFCKPSPIPIPTAPLNTAKAVRSIPTLEIATTTAIMINENLISLLIRTLTEGVISVDFLICCSMNCEINIANHRRTTSIKIPSITVNADILNSPRVSPMLSSTSVTGSIRFKILSAATVQTTTAINFDNALFLSIPVVRLIMTQAANRLTAIFIK